MYLKLDFSWTTFSFIIPDYSSNFAYYDDVIATRMSLVTRTQHTNMPVCMSQVREREE
jgi:hypothetical protein